jgi:hypothetical protein
MTYTSAASASTLRREECAARIPKEKILKPAFLQRQADYGDTAAAMNSFISARRELC